MPHFWRCKNTLSPAVVGGGRSIHFLYLRITLHKQWLMISMMILHDCSLSRWLGLLVFGQFVCQRAKPVHDSVVWFCFAFYAAVEKVKPDLTLARKWARTTLALVQKLRIMFAHTKQTCSNPGATVCTAVCHLSSNIVKVQHSEIPILDSTQFTSSFFKMTQ